MRARRCRQVWRRSGLPLYWRKPGQFFAVAAGCCCVPTAARFWQDSWGSTGTNRTEVRVRWAIVTGLLERLSATLASRYRLQRELGQGGMARVFLAHDLKYEREVAVKVLRPDLAAEVGAGPLPARDPDRRPAPPPTHPAAVRLRPGRWSGLLRHALHRGRVPAAAPRARAPAPVDDALQIAREVADALSYAHGASVVHRDIKPANILLDAGHARRGRFRHRPRHGRRRAPPTGHVVGTPAYMSPEQVEGSEYLDGRSDIYSLGCVLFEMLAGEPPFRGSTLTAVIANRLSSPAPSPRASRELVPEAVDAAVRKAMATLPADRFSTAVAVRRRAGHRRPRSRSRWARRRRWSGGRPTAASRSPCCRSRT